jgi:hypothetical protein
VKSELATESHSFLLHFSASRSPRFEAATYRKPK